MELAPYTRNGRRLALLWIILFLVVVGIIVAANLVFRPVGYYPWYPFGFAWIWVPFAFLFFFVLRWFFLPRGWGYPRGYRMGVNAYSILRERFARGEITREQFEQMSRDLQEHARA